MIDGWIKTYRKLQESWLWLDKEPFDKRSAWVDLLLTATHSDKKILFNGELITVKRGQIMTSIRKLAERWKWSYDKTIRFLKLLESDGMLQKESDNCRTLLTIVNYEIYQGMAITCRTPTSEPAEHLQVNLPNTYRTPTSEPISDKQEYKEDKNIKNNIYNNVEQPPVDADTESLYQYKDIIDYLNFKASTNYKHTSADTKKHIKARYNDGFKFEDFKTVIDKKVTEWKGTDMAKYIRPSTLFGTKFESYLNQSSDKTPKTKGNNTFNNYEQQRAYDFNELEKKLLRR